MKKGLWIVIGVIVFVLVVVKFALFNDYVIPNLKISTQSQTIMSENSPLEWKTLFGNKKYPEVSIGDLAKKVKATKVAAGESIHFDFDKEPNFYDIMKVEGQDNKLVGANIDIVAPSAKGTYTYKVTGDWDNGKAMYVFVIEVQ